MCFQRSSERIEGKSGCRSPGGRSLHSRGPAAEKLLSPSLLCVRGTSCFRISLEWDLNGRRPASDRRWQLSARYAGEAPAIDWCTSPAILNATRWRTGSQCSCRSTGVMWSLRRAPVNRRAIPQRQRCDHDKALYKSTFTCTLPYLLYLLFIQQK